MVVCLYCLVETVPVCSQSVSVSKVDCFSNIISVPKIRYRFITKNWLTRKRVCNVISYSLDHTQLGIVNVDVIVENM